MKPKTTRQALIDWQLCSARCEQVRVCLCAGAEVPAVVSSSSLAFCCRKPFSSMEAVGSSYVPAQRVVNLELIPWEGYFSLNTNGQDFKCELWMINEYKIIQGSPTRMKPRCTWTQFQSQLHCVSQLMGVFFPLFCAALILLPKSGGLMCVFACGEKHQWNTINDKSN